MTFPFRCLSAPRRATRIVAATVAALLLGSLLVVAQPRPDAASAAVSMRLTALETTHLNRLNDWRSARGLSRLEIDPVSQLDARQWTRSMADRRTLAHDPGAGDNCRAASSACRTWAENVGYASGGEAAVLAAFERSGGHRSNMASSAVDRVGIGVFIDGNGTTWVTQRFIGCGCRNDATATAANNDRARLEGYVRALYVDFLQRNPSGGEIATIVDHLVYGTDVVGLFAGSDEWLGVLIDGYYLSTLGRRADGSGKRYWIDAYRRGASPATIAASFFASDEFFHRSGGNNRAWVSALYREILGRSADGGGLSHWAGLADRGVARTDIAGSFYQSVESRRTRVTGLYQHLLARNPDSAGREYWSGVLNDGHDVRLAATLARSSEYVVRADRRY